MEVFTQETTTGKLTLFEVYSILVEQFGLSVSHKSVLEKYISTYKETSTQHNSDVLHLIKVMSMNYNVVCLTNIEIADICMREGLFAYFQKSFLSTELGFRKPDMEIYNYVLTDIDCSPYEVVFIDDKLENEGDRKISINAILFTNIQQLQKDLS